MKKKNILNPLLLIPLFLHFKGSSYASTTSLGIYPSITRINAKYGAHISTPITILNNSDRVIELKVSHKAFTASPKNDGSILYYSEKDVPVNVSNFLNTIRVIDNENEAKIITAFPRQYKSVSIQFDAPLKNGDYYFTTLFTAEKSDKSAEDSMVFINSSIGTNVLLSVNKKEVSGLINQLKMNSVIINNSTPIFLTVKNTSDNYVRATGDITIYDFMGKKVSQINLYPTIILSNSSRNMEADINNKKEAIIWREKLPLGFYTAKATIKFDDDYVLQGTSHTFGAPLFVIILTTLVFFIVLSVLYKTIRRLNFKE